MSQRRVTFAGSAGHALAGIVHEPVKSPRAWVLFAHCFTCTKNVLAAVRISEALVTHGFAVLRFDFTGLGESEGAFSDTTFSSNVADLVAAAEWLEREHAAPAVLVGHSFGGAAVLRAAARLPAVTAVATIGAPADPAHVRGLLGGEIERIRREGKGKVDIGGRPFTIGKAFLEDLERDDWRETLHDLRRALLVFHSPLDGIVPISNAQWIYENALHPKSFISLEDADHLLSRAEDTEYVAAVLAAWASRYVAVDRAQELPGNTEGVTARTGSSGFRTEISAGAHAFIADEPQSVGGNDLGPSPYDLLAAALASCTAMTLRMYADRKKLALESVSVRVTHDRVHERDCEHCEDNTRRIDRLRRWIELEGDLSAEERERLTEIADRCPVHKTLSGEIRIETHAAE